MKEIWKPLTHKKVKSNYYIISNYGRIYNIRDKRFIKGSITRKGYLRVNLASPKRGEGRLLVHRLVCDAFKLYKHNDKDTVNHIDGNKLNNRLDNLEWADYREQVNHAFSIGLNKTKYNEDFIRDICKAIRDGYTTPKKVCKYLNIEYDNGLRGLIYDIRERRTWINISKDYKW